MDAKEIRATRPIGRFHTEGIESFETFDILEHVAVLLREGVAQLAELSATLREEVKPDAIGEVTVGGAEKHADELCDEMVANLRRNVAARKASSKAAQPADCMCGWPSQNGPSGCLKCGGRIR